MFDFLFFTRSWKLQAASRGSCHTWPSNNLTAVSSRFFFYQRIGFHLDGTVPPHLSALLARSISRNRQKCLLETNSLLDIVPAETFSLYRKKRRKRYFDWGRWGTTGVASTIGDKGAELM